MSDSNTDDLRSGSEDAGKSLELAKTAIKPIVDDADAHHANPELELVGKDHQPIGDTLRSRLQDIISRIHASLDSSDDLEPPITDLNQILWNDSARSTFTGDLDGLKTILLLLKGSDDPVVLAKVLDTVNNIGSGKCGLEDDCVRVGVIAEAIRLLKHLLKLVRVAAAAALGTILDSSLDARKEVIQSDALDSFESMVDSKDDEEATPAVQAIFHTFKYMDSETCVMLTERFGKKVVKLAQSSNSSPSLVGFSCGFLANCLVLPESYPIGISLGCVDAAQIAYLNAKKSPHHMITIQSLRTLRIAAIIPPGSQFDSVQHESLERGMLPVLLDGMRLAEVETCDMAIIALGNVAKNGFCIQDFISFGIYAAMEDVVKYTTSGAIFQSCLRFIENIIHVNEAVASVCPRINVFVDVIMQKVAHHLMRNDESSDMLEMILAGLHEPLNHRVIREKLMRADGFGAYLHLLSDIMFKNPPFNPLSLITLQGLNNFLLDTDTCEAAHEAGLTSVLLDLVPRISEHMPWIVRCISCLVFKSEAARTFVDYRPDFIPLVRSTLLSDEKEEVIRGTALIVASLQSPLLHAKIIEAGLCTVLVELATSTPDKLISARSFWALGSLVDADDRHKQGTIRAIVGEQALQKTMTRVLSIANVESHELDAAMQFVQSVVRSGYISMPALGPGIIDVLRRSDTHYCVLWLYGLQCLNTIAETSKGREYIFRTEPTLELLKCPFEHSTLSTDNQVLAMTCMFLVTLSDDARLIPIIIGHGFVSHLLKLLPASDGLWRRNAARIIIKVLLYSDQGFQVALDSGLIQTLMDLLTSNESLPLEHAFKIICGCPTIHRKRLLSSSGLQDHIVCILSSPVSDLIRSQCFEFLLTLWSKDVKDREGLSHRGLVSCIKLQLSSEVQELEDNEESAVMLRPSTVAGVEAADGLALVTNTLEEPSNSLVFTQVQAALEDSNEENHRLISSRSAVSLLASLPLLEVSASESDLQDIFSMMSLLLRHHDKEFARVVLRAIYRMAAEGTTDIRRAILQNNLEDLVRLHSHDEYSSHAEAAESIKELASDPDILCSVLEQLAGFLDSGCSEDVLLSTALLVLDDLVCATDKTEAITIHTEMIKIGIPLKIKALASRPSCLVKRRAEQVLLSLQTIDYDPQTFGG